MKSMRLLSFFRRIAVALAGNLLVPIWIFAIAAPILYTFIGIYDAANYERDKPVMPSAGEYDRVVSALKEGLKNSPRTGHLMTEIDVYNTSIFSSRTVRITAIRVGVRVPVESSGSVLNSIQIANAKSEDFELSYENSWRFRLADFIFVSGAWVLTLYLLNWGGGALQSLILAIKVDHSNQSKATPTQDVDSGSISIALGAMSALERDVDYCRSSANRAQQQAAILVISGVAMALLGVVVFYFSLPPLSEIRNLEATERLQIALLASARPTLVLFFIEGVAWFLLRQYRIQSIDFKDLVERASSRTNVLASFHLADESQESGSKHQVISALLRTRSTTVLKSGESNAMLENEKIAASNPLWQTIDTLISKIPDANKNPNVGKRSDS